MLLINNLLGLCCKNHGKLISCLCTHRVKSKNKTVSLSSSGIMVNSLFDSYPLYSILNCTNNHVTHLMLTLNPHSHPWVRLLSAWLSEGKLCGLWFRERKNQAIEAGLKLHIFCLDEQITNCSR